MAGPQEVGVEGIGLFLGDEVCDVGAFHSSWRELVDQFHYVFLRHVPHLAEVFLPVAILNEEGGNGFNTIPGQFGIRIRCVDAAVEGCLSENNRME